MVKSCQLPTSPGYQSSNMSASCRHGNNRTFQFDKVASRPLGLEAIKGREGYISAKTEAVKYKIC